MLDHMISTTELAPLIGTPDAPDLIDVCIDEDFAEDPRLIPGARRWPFAKVGELAPTLTGRTIVICQKGLKLSQGVAAWLRTDGVDAAALTGGMVAWAAEGLPAIPFAQHPGGTLITANSPTVEEAASLWLLKRFAAPRARILTVESSQTANVADRFDGFVAPDDPEALAERIGLKIPTLARTFAALTGAERPGLAAVISGVASPEATLPIFDALYAAQSRRNAA